MSELKIAVVGCGGIGAVHIRSWAKVEDAKVVAACDAAKHPVDKQLLVAERHLP